MVTSPIEGAATLTAGGRALLDELWRTREEALTAFARNRDPGERLRLAGALQLLDVRFEARLRSGGSRGRTASGRPRLAGGPGAGWMRRSRYCVMNRSGSDGSNCLATLPARPPSSALSPTRSRRLGLAPSERSRSSRSTQTMFGRVVDSNT